MSETTINLGKIDYNNSGRRVYPVTLEIELRERSTEHEKLTIDLVKIDKWVELSICGNVWLPSMRDITSGGQNVDTIREFFSHSPKIMRLCDIWDKWHLNDLVAGSRRQTALLNDYYQATGKRYDFTLSCSVLSSAGLLVDNGYSYGSAWLIEPLPEYIINEVNEFIAKADSIRLLAGIS